MQVLADGIDDKASSASSLGSHGRRSAATSDSMAVTNAAAGLFVAPRSLLCHSRRSFFPGPGVCPALFSLLLQLPAYRSFILAAPLASPSAMLVRLHFELSSCLLFFFHQQGLPCCPSWVCSQASGMCRCSAMFTSFFLILQVQRHVK